MLPGNKLGFTIDLGKLHNVSLGQGQESVAEIAMEKASKEGHWVILQVNQNKHKDTDKSKHKKLKYHKKH